MLERLRTSNAAKLGSALHQLAHDCIKLGQRLSGNTTTMARYVNDVLGLRMTPELTLYYSDNCFGTADALGFRRDPKEDMFTLRVFDLKTGESKTSFDQLLIYCALFCLEYKIKPHDIKYELRIYQSNEVREYGEVDPKLIIDIQAQIIHLDKLIEKQKAAEA